MSGRQKLEAQLTENNIVKEVRDWDLWGEEGSVLAVILIMYVPPLHQELALLDGSNVVF